MANSNTRRLRYTPMNNNNPTPPQTILVTGATGYIGSRLIPYLLEAGYHIRAMLRSNPDRLAQRPWADKVEIVTADALKPETLPAAFAGVDVAYYLIHSMRSGTKFARRDVRAAHNFAEAAAKAGVGRLIYLGGLGDDDTELSHHLQSRHATGDALRAHTTPVTEFRAAVVVGSGSISFEMVRHLTERLPIMLHPRWADTPIQPIAVADLLAYLVQALAVPESAGKIIEVGGMDVTTYGDMMRRYAEVRNLKRRILRVPVLTPYLSSYWVHWVTPIPAAFARPLIEGARNPVLVTNEQAKRLFPTIEPVDYDTAVHEALRQIEEGDITSIWNDAAVSSQGDREPFVFTQEQGMLIERRERQVDAAPEAVFRAFSGLGGTRGWPPYQFLWELRGLLDRAVGGVGLRRGRRHPDKLWIGDALDFWRVEAVERNHLLRLRAEMKLPGKAWLQFETQADESGQTRLVQTAYFAPHGLLGYLYWYAIFVLHGPIFSRLIVHVAAVAEAAAETPVPAAGPQT